MHAVRMMGPVSAAPSRWLASVRIPGWSVDAVLAVAVAVLVDGAVAVATEPASRPPDAVAYLLGAAMGTPVLARRRWPLIALLATTVLLLVYYAARFPGLSPALPLAVVLYSAAAGGRLRWAVAVAAFFVVAGMYVLAVRHHQRPLAVATDMIQIGALLGVVTLLGEVVRSRRLRLSEASGRLRHAQADREREAARRVGEERLRIARELHDVLAHTTAAITVQAQVAADALPDSPAQALAALDAIRTVNREAMSELRATVGILRRDEAAPRSPTAGLDQVESLYAVARDAGLRVDATITGRPRPLPAPVDRAAYRLVQESLTNVLRHAAATRVAVRIGYDPHAVAIEIVDDGPGGGSPPGDGGHGIAGMTERATVLGGWLHAAPAPGGGFQVRALLPDCGGERR